MAIERSDGPRGILNPQTLARYVDLKRFLPSGRLAPYVEHYWQVRWKLPPGRAYTSETLPHPSVHLVIEPAAAYLQGVTTRRFSYTSRGRALVFSAKFLPGSFFPFVGTPLSELTDRRIPLGQLYGTGGEEVAAAVRGAGDEDGRIRAIEGFLEGLLERWQSSHPRRSTDRVQASCRRVRELIGHIERTRECTSVAQLAGLPGTAAGPDAGVPAGVRSLQALFNRYAGVGPKWVIRRYRLHEAVAVLDAAEEVDLAALAMELGYTDQAHFTNEFRAMTGRTPGRYPE